MEEPMIEMQTVLPSSPEQWGGAAVALAAISTLFSYLVLELRRARERAETLADEERKRVIDQTAEYNAEMRKNTVVIADMATAMREQKEVIRVLTEEQRTLRAMLESIARRLDGFDPPRVQRGG